MNEKAKVIKENKTGNDNKTNSSNKVWIEDLISDQKAKIEKLHLEVLKKAAQLGEQDGTLSLPRNEDSIRSPNEGMIKHEYQKLLADCYHEGKRHLDDPHLKYHNAVKKIKHFDKNKKQIVDEELTIAEQNKKDKLKAIHEEHDHQKTELANQDKYIQRDYLMAKQDLQDTQQKVGRRSPIIHFKSMFAYVLLLLGIGICEVPLNLQIFQKFGEAFFITIIMASSLAIAIPVLAHFSGVFIKQRKEKRDYLAFAIICVGLFLTFNFGVSIFRAYVLAENLGEDPDILSIVIFTCLNLILFVIGVFAAYFSHDESYELEYTYKNFQKEKKKYEKARKALDAKIKAVEDSRNKETKSVRESHIYEKSRVNDTKETLEWRKYRAILIYDELLNSFRGLEAYLDASYRTAIKKYRAMNLMHRKDHLSPKSWSTGIEPLEFKFQHTPELDPN